VQGGEPKRINAGIDNNSEPVFSFDTNYIYFVKEKNGQSNIYRLSILNAKIQIVTTGSGAKTSPVLSSNGKYLAYTVKRESGSSIEVINVETNSLVSSKSINNQDKVSFSPDSQYLIYKSVFNGKETLVTSKLDGDGEYPLSLMAGEVSQPSWGPWSWNGSSAEKNTDSINAEKLYSTTQEIPETLAESSYRESLNNQKLLENQRLKIQTEKANIKQAEQEAQLKLTQQQQSIPAKITQRESKRIALVIGNANYASAPLKNPLNDAADISAALRQSGFEVIDQRNATLQEMTKGIREFGDKLLKSDVGLVYYSGHGLEVKGKNYLLPVNASMIREDEIAFQAIDANLILEKMNTAKKSVNILIVDACRDNPFARSFRSVNRGLAQMDAPTGTIVSFSTAPGKTASDGDGRNSPFTKNLVKAMMRADMPIEAMFKEVRKSVVEETKGQQTPWESSSLIGDFYFKVSR
jgi:Caspase domain/WD40-like Beta Propeller Repeat